MRQSHNNHHLNWNKTWWERDQFSRRIRQHPGMIIRLPIKLHDELHHEIPPAMPPHRTLGIVALGHLNGLESADPLKVVTWHTDFLWHLAEADSRLGHEALKQAEHLERQIGFLGLRYGEA